MSLTRQIHQGLIADGLMEPPWKPTRDQLIGAALVPQIKRVPGRHLWESQVGKQPREYKVTAVIPHRATPGLLRLCVGFLQRQTEVPFVCIVDTGTAEASLQDVLALRSPGVEIHQVNCNGVDHPVSAVAYAMDLGQTACRTEYLWCIHSDCLVTRRTFLAELLERAGPDSPCIGYRTMPKPGETGECDSMVSHTCTLLHVPTLDDLDVTWSMRRLKRQAAQAGRAVQIDTEMALNYRLLDRGVKPIILGEETADQIEIDANRVHLRAATMRGVYPSGPRRDDSEILARLEKLLADDGDCLPEQLAG